VGPLGLSAKARGEDIQVHMEHFVISSASCHFVGEKGKVFKGQRHVITKAVNNYGTEDTGLS
jgi:hypothetical protein